MRLLLYTCIVLTIISSSSYSQYFWEFKQVGSSLGGPIDVEQNNPDNVYYGSNNNIYKSTDGGETFFVLSDSLPLTSNVKNIILNDDNPSEFLVAIENSDNIFCRILKTTDSGNSWKVAADSMFMEYFGIPMTPDPAHPDTIYTMNDSAFIRSTDFGETWDTLTTSVGCSAPCDIEVFPDTSIILIGDDGTGIFRSTDYGETWELVHSTTGEIPTVAVDYQTKGVAWAARWNGGGGILKSTDYGATWTPQTFFDGQNMWGIHVDPANSDFVIAGRFADGLMYITHDGGNNWVSAGTGQSNFQVYIVDTVTVFAAQRYGLWKLNSDYFVPVEITSLTASVIDDKIVLNWSTATETNNLGFEVERSYDKEIFFRIGFVEGNGSTTKSMDYTFSDQPERKNIFYRLKQVDFDGTFQYSQIVEVNYTIPAEFYLAQNYPNPFNPSTTISFNIPEESKIKIEIINSLGEVVSELIDEVREPGFYNETWNASNFSSGVYFVRMKAESLISGGNYFQTIKMIYLK